MTDRLTLIFTAPAGFDTTLIERAIIASTLHSGYTLRVDDPHSFHADAPPATKVVPFQRRPAPATPDSHPTPPRAA